jgi:hypothetical protein
MKTTVTALFTALVLSFSMMSTAPAATQSQTQHEAALTVMQGIPGLRGPADVYIDGMFQFSLDSRDNQGTLSLPEDTYLLEVRLQDGEVLSQKSLFEAGENYTAILHLTYINGDENGMKLSLFENTVQRIDRTLSRFDIRHTADAPALDIQLKGNADSEAFLERRVNVTNMDDAMPESFGESEVSVPLVNVELFRAGERTPLMTSKLSFSPLKNTYQILYLVGSMTDGTLEFMVQNVSIPIDRQVQ